MGARDEQEALGVYMHRVRRRWGSCFWRSWARVIRQRRPCVGHSRADMLRHGPEPRGRGARAGGAEAAFPQAGPDVVRGAFAQAGLAFGG